MQYYNRIRKDPEYITGSLSQFVKSVKLFCNTKSDWRNVTSLFDCFNLEFIHHN